VLKNAAPAVFNLEIGGVPLFWEDHCLMKQAFTSGGEVLGLKELVSSTLKVVPTETQSQEK